MVDRFNNPTEGYPNPGPLEELAGIADVLNKLHQRGRGDDIERPLEALKAAAEEMEEAWSGSWIGYHANVYYMGLVPPPPGEHFSPEWGIQPRAFVAGTTGNWIEHAPEDVTAIIYERAGNPDLEPAREFEIEARNAYLKSQRDLASIFEIVSSTTDSPLLTDLKKKTENSFLTTPSAVVNILEPQESVSRDRIAIYQGRRVPPHIAVLAEVYAIGNTIGNVLRLAEIVRQASTHIARQRRQTQGRSIAGTRIFIGHGSSHIWRALKDFIEDQLGLQVDEFNRVQNAGVSTTDRLIKMIDSSGIAFLVMTGEDEQSTGELRPRENVVHEAGLFQGRLGFQRAVILLEDGCEKFSNNAGLTHIPFPMGNIRAAFQDVRETLEREGFLNEGATL